MIEIDETTRAAVPTGIHASVLTGRDPFQTLVERIVVWADRLPGPCTRCGEPVGEHGIPVMLNGKATLGGELEPYDLKHGCGEWIGQTWVEVDSVDAIPAAAAEMARDRQDQLDAATDRIRRQLVTDLRAALGRLADGAEPGDITTGSDGTPGIYHDSDDGWVAWAFAANGDDLVTVYVADVHAAEDPA
jgi:hypothetical protein